MNYDTLKPLLFQLPPERSHSVAIRALQVVQGTALESRVRARYAVEDERLSVDAFGQKFPNPIGVAAGFDKNAVVPRGLSALGFGYVEVGGVTIEAQEGNPRPRLFRLKEDKAIINRMGFNNEGAEKVASNLASNTKPDTPIGINLGLSERASLDNASEEFTQTYKQVSDHGDYFVVNVSCPNLDGIKNLQQGDQLKDILQALKDEGAEPLLVKLSPDMEHEELGETLEAVRSAEIEGIIATNTSRKRPDSLKSSNRTQEGGLSGEPIKSKATEKIRFISERTDLPIIGVGGISTAEDAYRKIRAGASLVQLYTGLIYEGPSVAKEINRGLIKRLNRDGFDSLNEAVGVDGQ